MGWSISLSTKNVVEMRASGKHFVLHQPTEKELQKEHNEYCNKVFLEATIRLTANMKEFRPIDKSTKVFRNLVSN